MDMVRHVPALVVAVLVCCPRLSSGQSAAVIPCGVGTATACGSESLTLRQAIDEALARNPALIALRAQFEAARRRPEQERFLGAPTLEAQIWQWPLDTINPADVNMYMFTLRQDIPGPGKRRLREAAAAKDSERAANDIAIDARRVVDDVRSAYAELAVSREAVVIQQRSLDLLRQVADFATSRYAAAQAGQQEPLKAAVEISKLHADLVSLDERAQLAGARLNVLMGRAPGAPLPDLTRPPGDDPLPSESELEQRALDRHPELRGAQLEIERAEAALAVARRDSRPDFMVGGGYQLMPATPGAWMAMAGMTWPNAPWSRGAFAARTAEATAAVAVAQARKDATAAAVRLAVQQAYIRVSAARARASLLRTSVIPQTEQTVEAMRVAYQSGRGDLTAIIDTQRALVDARLGYARALSEVEMARADLERAVGADLTPARSEGR
jgi:outer membrane protein TolC